MTIEMNRRALLAGAAMIGALAATPSLAKTKKRRLVINGLGGLGDPNGGEFGEKEIAAHFLFERPIEDARAAGVAATNATLGYVFGDGDPFVATIDAIAWWDDPVAAGPALEDPQGGRHPQGA
jgi:membrane dipeptidase